MMQALVYGSMKMALVPQTGKSNMYLLNTLSGPKISFNIHELMHLKGLLQD